ncbi:hypothetical protein PFICI_00995 [Pestalotiopsis fici W106-1]|uniref:RING-type domain-containing protein n=1 Tax=Pestalotiopsis fici (strain W106-1 / CGMCC3.15140) TaxID=1229662 RepID=W3XNT4_PESFW|nr:uncharacterized protein PFICI_00995 [Pestalotiopsis fici W106-1]ETS87167.1 hypothetical protein PFICI_00995 [Pestalotiopsis fici W106-1]
MASKTTDNTLDGNLITNVLNYFDASGDLCGDVTCKVECSICTTELAILQPADEEHKTWTVLEACGHMFCHECIVSWIRASDDPKCPQCRADLRHSRCRHKYKPHEIVLTNGFNIHDDVPKVVSELPGQCQDCKERPASTRSSDSLGREDYGRLFDSSSEEDRYELSDSDDDEYDPTAFRRHAYANIYDYRPAFFSRSIPDGSPRDSARRGERRRHRDGSSRSRSHHSERPMGPRPILSNALFPPVPPPPHPGYIRRLPGPIRYATHLRLDGVEYSHTYDRQD